MGSLAIAVFYLYFCNRKNGRFTLRCNGVKYMKMNNQFLPQDGRYDDLKVYQKAECICDITDYFCKTFMNGRIDRTVDQMVQAARSGKQNIVEGTAASSTSKETEIKLLNVAKASHLELLEDYKDYLAHHGLVHWQKDSANYEHTRKICKEHNDRDYYQSILPRCTDEMIANIAITLIHQEDVMLRNLIEFHKQEFLKYGGIREEMTRGRIAYRNGQNAQSVTNNSSEKEQELNKREILIAQREQMLDRKEAELRIKEEEIARLLRLGNVGSNKES